MATLKVEPANHPQAQTLSHVRVGQYVWLDTTYSTRVDRRLVEIGHISKSGRLFFSHESLWNNWRYGFDPLTGKAPGMSNSILRFATDEETRAELARIEAVVEAKKQAEIAEVHAAKVRAAAPQLLSALREAKALIEALAPITVWDSGYKSSVLAVIDEATKGL